MLRTWGRRLYAPLVLVGFNGAAIWMFSTSNRLDLVRLLVLFAAAIAVSFSAERWIPYQQAWNLGRQDGRRDVSHTLVNETITFLSVGLIPGMTMVRRWRAAWPDHWPLVGQVLLAIIVADICITLAHYISHRWAWLWRFHLPHHASERLYGLNGFIQHPLHQAFEVTLGALPLVMIGLPRRVGLLLAFAVAIQLLLQHSNVDIRLGPLRYLLAVGPVHRRHHTRRFKGFGVNFGLFTNLWDLLLGVADVREDSDIAAEDVGLGDYESCPAGYGRQLAYPFLRQAAPGAAPGERFLRRTASD
ncbi:MAG TPA: sterol desaturase family protein [Caulobacteraceae bacterium]|nr:sterol desaturase family protein [Caulobacteraceae bacterium]